jgi:glycosyltransferase involved in cell wall biosynthesis
MKIAVIATSSVPAATANSIQVMKVCQALTEIGFTVHLWVPGTEQISWDQIADYYGLRVPFEISWIPTPLTWRRYDFAWKAISRAKTWGADVIYTWMPQTALFSLWRKIPVLNEIHMLPSGRIGPWLFRQFIKHPGKKRLIIITDALRRSLEQTYLVDFSTQDFLIAPMGSEPERYTDLPDPPGARTQLGLPDKITVGYTGHFYRGRGMEVLLGLALAFPEVHFLWIGGHPQDKKYWQEHLLSSGIQNVSLTGFIPNSNLPLYQAAADILVMPYGRTISVSSGGNTADVCSPMKMFDYIASGRAIITSDLPVLHEVLNTNNAVFCPPDDLAAWTAALGHLLSDETLRKQLSDQAKSDALKYTWRSRAKKSLSGF